MFICIDCIFVLFGITETINVLHSLLFFQGDEVLAVNGVDVKGKSAFEVSSSIQGPNETFVTIKVVIYLQLCWFSKIRFPFVSNLVNVFTAIFTNWMSCFHNES